MMLSEVLKKAEAKGVLIRTNCAEDEVLFRMLMRMAENGVTVARMGAGHWARLDRYGGYELLKDISDFRTAVLAAFDRELDSISAGKESPDAR